MLLRKEKKMLSKNGFLIFDLIIKNMKENQIQLKLIKKLYILKLFRLCLVLKILRENTKKIK